MYMYVYTNVSEVRLNTGNWSTRNFHSKTRFDSMMTKPVQDNQAECNIRRIVHKVTLKTKLLIMSKETMFMLSKGQCIAYVVALSAAVPDTVRYRALLWMPTLSE